MWASGGALDGARLRRNGLVLRLDADVCDCGGGCRERPRVLRLALHCAHDRGHAAGVGRRRLVLIAPGEIAEGEAGALRDSPVSLCGGGEGARERERGWEVRHDQASKERA